METGRTGVTGHDANLIHSTPHGKLKRRWLLFTDWVDRKFVQTDLLYHLFGLVLIVGILLGLVFYYA